MNLNVETEYKYLISQIPKICKSPTHICQYYLSNNSITFLNNFLNTNFNNEHSFRIRNIDDKIFYLTIKSKGLLKRQEYEITIDEQMFNCLYKKYAINQIQKERYILLHNNLKYEFDSYKIPEKLNTVEVEVKHPNIETKEEIENYLKYLGVRFKDITYLENYKNNNLARSI